MLRTSGIHAIHSCLVVASFTLVSKMKTAKFRPAVRISLCFKVLEEVLLQESLNELELQDWPQFANCHSFFLPDGLFVIASLECLRFSLLDCNIVVNAMNICKIL